jgi:phospholipid/cholesterol/gamma-HCH transport system ATP-binding protein
VAVVEVRDLVAKYGPRTILEGVDLTVEPGEVRVILGGSGSGKTTLLKHLIGLLSPASGTVHLLGQSLPDLDEGERELLLRRIGMLFQGSALLNSMTLVENVALPLREHTDLPEPVIHEMVRLKLRLVGLDAAEHRFPSELSGGMKKRAALARAMALDPDILFCDEPSAGLDPVTSAALDRTLLDLRDRFGVAVVVVTHELASIRAIADRVVMLDRGRVAIDGTLSEAEASDHPTAVAFFGRATQTEEAVSSLLSRFQPRNGGVA